MELDAWTRRLVLLAGVALVMALSQARAQTTVTEAMMETTAAMEADNTTEMMADNSTDSGSNTTDAGSSGSDSNSTDTGSSGGSGSNSTDTGSSGGSGSNSTSGDNTTAAPSSSNVTTATTTTTKATTTTTRSPNATTTLPADPKEVSGEDTAATTLSIEPSKITAENVGSLTSELGDKTAEVFDDIPDAVFKDTTAVSTLIAATDASPASKEVVLAKARKAYFSQEESELDATFIAGEAELLDGPNTAKLSGDFMLKVLAAGLEPAELPVAARSKMAGKVASKLTEAAKGTVEQIKTMVGKAKTMLYAIPPEDTKEIFDKLLTDGDTSSLDKAKLNPEQAQYLAAKVLKSAESALSPTDGSKVTKAAALTAFNKVPKSAMSTINSSMVNSLDSEAALAVLELVSTGSKPSSSLDSDDDSTAGNQAPPSAVGAQLNQMLRAGDTMKTLTVDQIRMLFQAGSIQVPDLDKVEKGELCQLTTDEVEDVTRTNKAMCQKLNELCGNLSWRLYSCQTPETIRGTGNDVSTHLTVKEYCKEVWWLERAQIEALVEVVVKRADADFGDAEKVKNFACVMPYLNDTVLQKVADIKSMCHAMGSRVDIKPLPLGHCQGLLDFCLSRAIVSLRLLSAPHFPAGWPSLISCLNKTHYDKYITCGKVSAALDVASSRISRTDVAQEFYKCANKTKLKTAAGLIQVYPLADFFSTDDWTSIPTSAMCGLRPLYATLKQRHGMFTANRMGQGFSEDWQRFNQTTAGTLKALTKFQEAEANAACSGSSARRRRRATAKLTCSDVYEERGLLSARSTSDITEMEAAEFKKCSHDIGRLALPDGHLAAFATKAKDAYGAVNTWSAERVMLLGGVVSGLNMADIQAVQTVDLNVVTYIGAYGSWKDSEKTKVMAEKYVTGLGGADKLTSADLVAMGDIAGGLHSNHIDSAPSAAYCGSAPALGALTNLEETQLVSWAKHAVVCWGTDVSAWSASNVKAAGSVLGGLADADLAKLTVKQIEQISVESIRMFPNRKFASLTVDQLSMLNPAQAAAVTPEQYSSLSAEQRAVIDGLKGTVVDTTPPDSGAGVVSSSMMLIAVTMLATWTGQ